MSTAPSRLVSICVGLALAVAAAQAIPLGPTPAGSLVARFVAALDGGDAIAARASLGPQPTLAVQDLGWRTWHGPEAAASRVDALVAAGTRIASEPVALLAEGAVLVTRDLVWTEDAPAPDRYTGVYVVAGGRIAAVTWLLASEQRDALAAAWLVGSWRWREAAFYLRFDPDGGYRADTAPVDRDGQPPQDSGTFRVVDGVVELVSGADTRYCCPGQSGRYLLFFAADDRLQLQLLDDDCWTRRAPSAEPLTFDRLRAAATP
jgi:hypothetical protein